MAARFPNEGLDFLLNIVPRNSQASPATLYLGAFTSQTGSSVPNASAVLATQTGVTEVTGDNYARVALSAATWGTPASGGSGIRSTAHAAVELPVVGFSGWGTVNGYFLASALTGGIALLYANFDDLTPVVTAWNDRLVITPTWAATTG